MIDLIQRYRRDLYESKKKRSIKYRDFYKLWIMKVYHWLIQKKVFPD
jgi:hypothetical protein